MVLLILSLKKVFIKEKNNVKIDSAASTGNHGKITYFISVTWLPLKAGTVDLKVLFLIYACLETCVSYLHVSDSLIFDRNCPA